MKKFMLEASEKPFKVWLRNLKWMEEETKNPTFNRLSIFICWH